MTTPGTLKVLLELKQRPTPTMDRGFYAFQVNAEGIRAHVRLRRLYWNVIERGAAAAAGPFVVNLTGDMGQDVPGGFQVDEPTAQVFEKPTAGDTPAPVGEGQPVPGQLKLAVTLRELPAAETDEHGWKKFDVAAAGRIVRFHLRARKFAKMAEAASGSGTWEAVLTGTMGQRFEGGFALVEPEIVVTKREARRPVEKSPEPEPVARSQEEEAAAAEARFEAQKKRFEQS